MGYLISVIILVAIIEIATAVFIQNYRVKRKTEQKNIEARSNFLSTMSHEIRTPINAVIGMNEMILRESSEKTIKEYATNISLSSQMLLSLINDILDYSKIDSGKMEIIQVDFRLKNIIKDIINMVMPRVEAKGLTFEYDVPNNIPSGYIGDEIRIKQILTNIVTNAVKYTPEGSVKLSISVVEEENDDIYLLFSVKDTGIGIKNEDIVRLSDTFVRFDEEKNAGIEGTGLGLAITKKLLELMGSELKIASVYGKGSDFYFVIKLQVSDKSPIGEIMDKTVSIKEGIHTSFTAPDAYILVVDDNEMNLKVVQSLLKETNINVTCVDSGYRAVEYCRNNFYDIIFMDHMMPGMDGVETLAKIKELSYTSPSVDASVIALTANAISGYREFFLEHGFSDYLTKPIDVNELYEIIKKHLPKEKILELTEEEKNNFLRQSNMLINIDGKEIDISNLSPLSTSNISGETAMKYCSGDIGNYLKILRAYYIQGKEMLDRVRYIPGKLFMADDMNDFSMKAHTLKSTSMTIGAIALSNVSKELEFAAKDNVFKIIDEKLPICRQLYEECISEIELYLMKIDILPKNVMESYSGDLDKDVIKQIKDARDAVDNFDNDLAIEILDNILNS